MGTVIVIYCAYLAIKGALEVVEDAFYAHSCGRFPA